MVALDPTQLLICRERRDGVGISEESIDYLAGQPVYASDFDETKVSTLLTDVTSTTESVILSFGSLFGAFDEYAKLAGALGAAGPLLSIVTHFIGKSETDMTEALIRNGVSDMTRQIESLSAQVKNGFLDIRKDLADISLDGIMSRLQAIDEAYKALVSAVDSDGVTSGDKLTYSRLYR
jgi:hypothetical protein